ncbi:unnamed protein product [Thlaspi arvense]|uniref:Uncharacterized protein n=1 Tax=Thlaspi arvense TaxID=13288 RepID=A0AAU9RZV4_THLAR|nr:unnamed protein product [Thlaspi arvense]
MTTNACDVNHLDADSLLPPRKRLLAGFKKQNSESGNDGSSPSPPPPPSFGSSSSTSYSNGSSSASTDVQTHLHNLMNDSQSRSPEELAEASKEIAALAAKAAKAARATANEKAIIASRAVAAAKRALEVLASFPALTVKEEWSPRKNKQTKHVPVQLLYSKDEDLARRLNRAINNSPRVATGAVTSTMYDGHDVAGVVDSESDEDDGSRGNGKLLLGDGAMKEKTGEASSSMGKRRGRAKVKKLPLSMCDSKDEENGINNVGASNPLAEPEGSDGGVEQVRS